MDSPKLLNTHQSPLQTLRERAITEYHEILAADATVIPAPVKQHRWR